MVVVNTSEGTTHSFDLAKPTEAEPLQSLLASGSVTAIAIRRAGTTHSLASPRGFNRSTFGAYLVLGKDGAPLAEQVYVHAGDVRVSLTWTMTGNVVRTDLARLGSLRYNAVSPRLGAPHGNRR